MTAKKKRKHRRPEPPPPVTTGFRQRGRPTDLTEALVAEVCTKIATGDSFRDACLSCGIDEDAGHEWVRRGKGTDDRPSTPLYARFAEGVKQSVAQRRRFLKGLIRRAAVGTPSRPGDWKAAQALGAMADPKEFVPQMRIHVVGELDGALDRLKEAFGEDSPEYAKAMNAIAGATADDETEGSAE